MIDVRGRKLWAPCVTTISRGAALHESTSSTLTHEAQGDSLMSRIKRVGGGCVLGSTFSASGIHVTVARSRYTRQRGVLVVGITGHHDVLVLVSELSGACVNHESSEQRGWIWYRRPDSQFPVSGV